ncbi:fatty acid desaturase [Sphingobacteriales bacterium UPWRP_1]|nr:fatty acid desaturase [Sphingobacteriales bacterium TSM_CSM]PSJ74198.1 fatty acid desaturase [Sphingobacteriales bacterium UPWRP_1]
MTDREKTGAIHREISALGKNLKERYPLLKHQNAIGFGIFTFAIAMILLAGWAYLTGRAATWAVILWIAFWTSILHELEHDLIHYLYFKNNRFMHNLMLLGVWIFRPLTLNPWLRRHLHLHHHKYSGTATDLEERGVTNGQQWGILRFLSTPDLILASVLNSKNMRQEIGQLYREGKFTKEDIDNLRKTSVFGFWPFGIPLHLVWYSFVLYYFFFGLISLLGLSLTMPAWLQSYIGFVTPMVVLLVAPNLIRQFCLHFITSNMHYYGDVERGNIMQQTQVLNAWWLLPLQLFCFNFGSTHTIHHFVVQETFYVRQFTAPQAHKILQNYGVRFNDLGTFTRANRFKNELAA